MSGAAVTPSGVREGDPAALAALCTVRGPSVLAYCRQVAGESEAGPAAAEAFARFRKAVVEAGDTTSLNPEALLISATRTAAAARARVVALGHCAAVPRLLAERAEKTLPDADLMRLEAHLAECWTCRAPVARFKAAERAYLDPPEQKLEPAVAEQILAALVAAVPPPPEPEPAPPAPEVTSNGAAPYAVAPPDPDATQAFIVGQPTAEFQAPGMVEYDPADVAADETSSEPASRPKRARRGAPALLGGLPRRGKRSQRGRARPAPAASEAAAAAAATALAAAPLPAAAAQEPAGAPLPEAAAGEAAAVPAHAPAAGEAAAVPAHEPAASEAIPYEASEYAPRPRDRRDRRSRRSRRLPLILPILLVLLALLIALYVSGVFGGSEPASSPRVSVPVGAPGATTTPRLVGVPGAKNATARQVELAKARDRARQRGETLPSDKPDSAAKKTTTAATTPPPPPPAASATPARNTAAAPPPPPPPPPAAKPRSSAQKQIDARSGATGAEQIPPPADTSGVPDLAPPAETASP
jgi:hypothetical protein